MKKLLTYIGILLAIASCTKDETTTFVASDGTVQLSAGVTTRVSDSDDCAWKLNDEVGVFTDQSNETNLLFTISNISTGAMSNGSGVELTTLDGDTRSYYAYHPRKENQSSTKIAIDCTTSQSTPLLYATATNNSKSVKLQFDHQLAKVAFSISISEVYSSSLTGCTAKLTGAYATADFDLEKGEFSDEAVADISLTLDAATGSIVAYIPPMKGVSGNVKLWITTADDKIFVKTITTTDWDGGSSYSYKISVGGGVSRLSFTGGASGCGNISVSDDDDVISSLLSKFRRCLMTTNSDGGAVICYLDDDDSNYYNDDDTTSATLTGEEGDVMVYMPEYWYKYEDADADDENFRYYISESSIAGGVHVEASLVGAYKATISGGEVRSISGATPTSASKSAFEAALPAGYQLIDYEQHCSIAMMLYAKYYNRNIQTKLGTGSAGTSSVTGSTNSMGNTDTNTTDATAATYVNGLAIEGVFGGLYEWVSGVSITSEVWTITNPDGSTRTVQAGASTGYISSMALEGYSAINGTVGYSTSFSQYFDMVPASAVGDSATYYADQYTHGSGTDTYCLARSGYTSADYGGVACAHAAYTDASTTDSGWGSRLAFRGTINVATSVTEYQDMFKQQ